MNSLESPPPPLDTTGFSEFLRTEIGNTKDPNDLSSYVGSLLSRYQGMPALNMLTNLAEQSRPVEYLSSGVDAGLNGDEAFLAGAVLGLRSVEALQGEDVVQIIGSANVGTTNLDSAAVDVQDKQQIFATILNEMADVGYAMAREELVDLLDDWDIRVTKDATKTIYFKRGFGVVLFLGAAVIAQQNEALARQQEAEAVAYWETLGWSNEAE